VDALTDQVRTLVDAGDVAGLADLTPPDEQGAALIEAAMLAAAATAAEQAAQEVRDQGADVDTPGDDALPAGFLAAMATATAGCSPVTSRSAARRRCSRSGRPVTRTRSPTRSVRTSRI
jgi:hypothetical protein